MLDSPIEQKYIVRREGTIMIPLLVVLLGIAVLVIIGMILLNARKLKSEPEPEPKEKVFGLKEAEDLLQYVTDTEKNSVIQKAILGAVVWFVKYLGYKNIAYEAALVLTGHLLHQDGNNAEKIKSHKKEIEDIKTLVAEIEIATKNINGRM